MDEQSPEEQRRRLKELLRLGNMIEGENIPDDLIENALNKIDFSRPVGESPAIIAHDRATERAKTEQRDFMELFMEEYRAAKRGK